MRNKRIKLIAVALMAAIGMVPLLCKEGVIREYKGKEGVAEALSYVLDKRYTINDKRTLRQRAWGERGVESFQERVFVIDKYVQDTVECTLYLSYEDEIVGFIKLMPLNSVLVSMGFSDIRCPIRVDDKRLEALKEDYPKPRPQGEYGHWFIELDRLEMQNSEVRYLGSASQGYIVEIGTQI